MAIVNDTHKSALSVRNSEPSHIAGKAPYTEIGGVKSVDAEPNTATVDGAKGVGTDTSIPKSVGAEKSHLGRVTGSEVNEDDDVDVKFDGDDDLHEEDDIDKELDKFEDVEPVDVDVDVEDDDKKKVNEETDDDKPAFLKKKGEDVDEEDDSEDDDKKDDLKEDSEDAERGENNSATAASIAAVRAVTDSGTNDVKEEDEDDDADEKKLEEEDDELKKDEDDAAEPEKAMNESVKIRIKLPNSKLFESVGVSKKNQKKVGVLFESALRDAVKQASTQIHKHYKKLHESKLAKRDARLARQLDGYMNYVVEEWVKKNRVAVRSSLRSQLAEEFLNGLQTLFKEHYIDVPASKVDVVKQLTKTVAALKTSLNEQVAQKMKLRRLAESANKSRIVAQFIRGQKLSEGQIAKLEKLAEDTQYVNAKDYREKISMLRESYFPADKKELKHLPEETVADVKTEKKTNVSSDPLITATLAASKQMNDTNKW